MARDRARRCCQGCDAQVYARYFPSDPPARSFICVGAWHGPFDVEMDCVAAV